MAKLQFDAVHLEFEMQRLGSTRGMAATSTSRFSTQAGCTIELDTSTGLVTVAHGESGASAVFPREKVKYFEPLKLAPAQPPVK